MTRVPPSQLTILKKRHVLLNLPLLFLVLCCDFAGFASFFSRYRGPYNYLFFNSYASKKSFMVFYDACPPLFYSKKEKGKDSEKRVHCFVRETMLCGYHLSKALFLCFTPSPRAKILFRAPSHPPASFFFFDLLSPLAQDLGVRTMELPHD